MKKLAFLAISFISLTACNIIRNQARSEKIGDRSEKAEKSLIGGSKDEHGCIAAAGQSWSELKQDCIQVFNVGQRLNPTERKKGQAVHSAFVVFSDDHSKLELFLPDRKKNIILFRAEDDIYKKDNFKYDAKQLAIYENDTIKFKAEIK